MFTWIFHSYSENRLFISRAQAETLSELQTFFYITRILHSVANPFFRKGLTTCLNFTSTAKILVQLEGFWLSPRPKSIDSLLTPRILLAGSFQNLQNVGSLKRALLQSCLVKSLFFTCY